jgi:hypothetical protein
VHQCNLKQPQTILLMRLTADGALDSSFGNTGTITLGPIRGTATDFATPLISDDRGRPVVAVHPSQPGLIGIERFLPNGSIDRTFGHSGVATARIAADSWTLNAFSLFQTKVGRYTIAGCTQGGPYMARFNNNGSPYRFWGGAPAGENTSSRTTS